MALINIRLCQHCRSIKNWKQPMTLLSSKRYIGTSQFVPEHSPVADDDVVLLRDFIKRKKQLLVVTGAGISTESGIPDYRSEGVGMYARTSNRPVQYKDFLMSESVRQRYWARNFVGWPRFSAFQPNVTHFVLRDLEQEGKVLCIVTQNVDSLHSKAGSQNVVELHGAGARVICLGCDMHMCRHEFQKVLMLLNPGVYDKPLPIRPDGDVDIPPETIKNFKVPPCIECGGILKPDIVFFGGNVPLERVEYINNLLHFCDGLMVLGSSLTVFSGYRIVILAHDLQRDIAIVNIGPTRGDSKATLRIHAKCGDIFTQMVHRSKTDI